MIASLSAECIGGSYSFEYEGRAIGSLFFERCQKLEEHGSTIVTVPGGWQSMALDRIQEQIINAALQQMDALNISDEANDLDSEDCVRGFDAELAGTVLNELNRVFPGGLDIYDLKRTIKPEPSDKTLLTALDALRKDHLLQGKALEGHSGLVTMTHIEITAEGRKRLSSQVANRTEQHHVINGDQINIHGSVGAVGRNSQGVVNVYEAWKRVESQVDMKTLAVELEQLRVELRKTGSSREDDKQVALLGEAAYEAENGNGNGIAAALSNAGMNVLKMARDIGTDVAAKVIAELMKG
jgi:hypothetical protein